MKENFLNYDIISEKKTILNSVQGMKNRSMISKVYAENFYKRFLQEEIKK